jgi:dipeptidyl aminopeptidase/acylaminoacyl peptidase
LVNHLTSECPNCDCQFSKGGDYLYLTVGDHARVKIFVISVPPTPRQSTAQQLSTTPVELTSSHAASAIQPLSSGRLLFTQSSLTSPNDVFILRELDQLETDLEHQKAVVYQGQPQQITRLTEDALKGKDLAEGEDFWFKSAGNDVHGWILKPKGWKVGDKKKWPVLMFIHGGLLNVHLTWARDELGFPPRTTGRLGRLVVNSLESQRFCAARLFRNCYQSNRIDGLRPRLVMALPANSILVLFGDSLNPWPAEFTDAIAEDWGGKPFVDLKNGWQYVLDKYQEVCA